MSSSPMPSGRGRRRSVDAAINLVPFIDLLSCCLAFLLITAVWSQLGHLDVQSPGGEGGDAPALSLTLFLDGKGYTLVASDQPPRTIPLDDARLAEAIRAARTAYPALDDISVQATDDIPYDRLIRTLDILRGANFLRLSVAGAPS